MKRLRSDMQEISREQGKIKERQRQVREKFEAVESECELLRKETNIIMRQSMSTQTPPCFHVPNLESKRKPRPRPGCQTHFRSSGADSERESAKGNYVIKKSCCLYLSINILYVGVSDQPWCFYSSGLHLLCSVCCVVLSGFFVFV
ncbi:hypothetical protein ES332_A13G151100v1 [Gossypium tomentosum]|nr:hypothetical protein ES332_A13G151100v1 [Gossypium tomentosum]TYH91977.1 hypothetical protein ES332_A13G151100v1 [Gossypium tomentosum]